MAETKRRIYKSPAEAFAARTIWRGDCLVWMGGKNPSGYGRLWDGERLVYPHRWAYEQEHGPIPDGLEIDHLCWERACCNTAHLRLATRYQNTVRRAGANRNSTTGARGVYREGKAYRARVKYGGRTRNFGTYSTVAEASAAVRAARLELFGEHAGL